MYRVEGKTKRECKLNFLHCSVYTSLRTVSSGIGSKLQQLHCNYFMPSAIAAKRDHIISALNHLLI